MDARAGRAPLSGFRPAVKHLVVARYAEDLGWLAEIPKDWQPLVVEKNVDMPNEGREASSYFLAIGRLYDALSPDDLLAFVQGYPLDHCPELRAELEVGAEGFRWIGHWHVHSNEWGAPYHSGLPVRDFHERWIGPWQGNVDFIAGAQFIVTGRQILAKSKALYARLLDEMSLGQNPWVMERLWEAFFTRGGKDGAEP